MKQRIFTFIILFFSVIGISAQEISVKSFRLLPEDLTARVNPVKNDNAQTCALVKIVTTERGFEFDPDALGMCKSVDETHAGEVWIWLAPGSRRLTIRHSTLGVLRNYEYPVAIESACTYEMVLVTGRITTIVEEQNKANFVAITFLPQNAQLKIDNAPVATRDGSYAHTLPVGKHTYELLCPMYHTLSGEFQILPDSTTSINVALQPNFGQLAVYSEPESGADVFINGEKKGVTPYTSSQLQSGFCQVQVVKNMFQPAEQQVEIRDGDTAVVRLTMQPNFGEPELVCADSATEIWIDGVRFGAGRWSGRLEAGIHLVELRKPSHRVVSQSIEVKNGERRSISLPPSTPIYGQVSVNVLPLGADILLDGKIVGQTPRMLDHILIGEHEIKLQKAGCTSVTRTIMVKEGETAEVTAELATGRQVMLKSDPAGASLYIDGSYAGTAPYSVALSFGTHTVKAVNDGVTKQETITVSENGQSEWTLNVQKDGQSCGTVKDYDGNTYATVQIGEQCWMKENLRTTHYADGNSILYGTTTSRGTTIPQDGTTSYNVGYWYYPDNNSSNKATYGLLYNWKAVMSKSSSSKSNPSGVQGICPKGWHVPSDAEWTQLTNYVSSQNRYCYGGNTKEIAKALASTTGWVTSREPCDVGNDPSSNNAMGFSAIPAGCYPRRDFGYNAYYWSATEYEHLSGLAYIRDLYYGNADVYRKYDNANRGCSVRCLRDSEKDSVTKEETITVSENGQSERTLNVQKDGQSCGTVKDYDGNIYATVQIGDQCWMKENLRTTHYADGAAISHGYNKSTTTDYWYYPDDNFSNKATYGLLYNWKAVMRNSSSSSNNPSGVQGICPNGWHVPSDAEWKQLEMAVGMSQSDADDYGWRGDIAAKLCGNTGWDSSSEANAAGNTSAYSRNSSEFSALPAGIYYSGYVNFSANAYFWSATEVDGSCAYYRNLRYDQADIYRKDYNKYFGLSVRCVRDFDTGSLKAVNDGVGKAQHKPLTQKAHVAESEVSATDREQLTEEANDTIRGAAKLKQRAPMGIFFTLNAACSTAPQWSGGLRVGTTRKWGWNVSLMTNFNMKAAKAELPEAGTQYAFAAKKSSRLSATAGPVWHPDPRVLLFLNAGYGYRGVCYQALADGEFYRYQNGTLQGAECSLGVMLNIKGLLLSIEATTINFKYGEFKFGLGGIIYKRSKVCKLTK